MREGVRQRISAHDDWAFAGHDSWLVCVSREAFKSADEVKRRVDEVVGLVAAFPRSVLPARVDHSVDDLAQRIRQLHSADDAIVFLEHLTPDERDRLARSDTPLAGFSDIRKRATKQLLGSGHSTYPSGCSSSQCSSETTAQTCEAESQPASIPESRAHLPRTAPVVGSKEPPICAVPYRPGCRCRSDRQLRRPTVCPRPSIGVTRSTQTFGGAFRA